MRINNRSPFVRARQTPKAQAGELFIYDEIGFFGIQAEEFVRDLNAIESDEIHLRINSPGGSVFDGQAMVTAIRQHSAKVITHVDGLAASMASLIAIAGDEVRMSDGAFMMIHDPWSIAIGSAQDMRKEANVLDKVGGALVAAYTKRTGLSEDKIKGLMADETWFEASEAVELGLADAVEESQAAEARFDLSVFSNVPDRFKAGDSRPAPKELERLLREAGLSRSEARDFVSVGQRVLKQREADEGLVDTAAAFIAEIRAGV